VRDALLGSEMEQSGSGYETEAGALGSGTLHTIEHFVIS